MQKYARQAGGAALAGGWQHDARTQNKLVAPGQ